MSAIYAVISAVALGLAGVCCFVDKQKDIWLRLIFFAVFVCDLGYFLVSVSQTMPGALMANRVVFLGSAFLPFLMLMKIMCLCRTTYPKKLPTALIILAIVAFVSASIPGTFKLYYINISFVRVDGVSRLVREYGKFYIGYILYYVVYSLSMLGVIVRAARVRRLKDPNHAGFLMSAVLVNLVVWIMEKIIPTGFETLTVCYLLSELFILFMHMEMQRIGAVQAEQPGRTTGVPAPTAQEPAPEQESGNNEMLLFTPDRIAHLIDTREELAVLSEREKEVLRHILANEKRKDIADILVVTESTIKKHTSQIYKKLGVNSRIELFARINSME